MKADTMKTITAEELKEKDVRIINVLSKEHYDQLHITGSESIPLDELEKGRWKELMKGNKVVVYCASYACGASGKAAKFLEEKGIDVLDYEGGMQEWAEKGLPVQGDLSREEFLEG